MKKYQYGVVGSFAFKRMATGGQAIKTQNFANALETFSGKQLLRVDTRYWKKHPVKLLKEIAQCARHCEEIIVLPADRGVFVISPLVLLLSLFGKNSLAYIAVGGWLPQFLKEKKWLKSIIKRYDKIYVETSVMQKSLYEIGLENVFIFPNFKTISPITESELVYTQSRPFKLCTFSRILYEKGIEDAVTAVKTINEKAGETVYHLDIYGRVDPSYEDRFAELVKTFPDYISYQGVADNTKSPEVLRDYYALLFPTHYYTEGIPGTIIDAYFSGIPVISSKWESFADVVDDGKTGIGYNQGAVNELIAVLERLSETPQILNNMKKDCLVKANEFTAETAMKIFCNR